MLEIVGGVGLHDPRGTVKTCVFYGFKLMLSHKLLKQGDGILLKSVCVSDGSWGCFFFLLHVHG